MSTKYNSKRMGRPRVDSEMVQIRIQRPLLSQIDHWAKEQGISRTEAIRRLATRALSLSGKPSVTTPDADARAFLDYLAPHVLSWLKKRECGQE